MKSKQNIGRILLMAGVPVILIAMILFFVAGTQGGGAFAYVGGAFTLLSFVGSIIGLIFTVVDCKVPLIANLVNNGLTAGFAFLGGILGVIGCSNGIPAAIACCVIGFLFAWAVAAFFIVCCIYKVRFVKHVVYKETTTTNTNKEENK